MEAKRAGNRWTYTEFTRLPTSGSTRYEVIGDELVVTPAPGLRHQRVVGELFARLHVFAKAHQAGEVFVSPVDVLLGEGDYLEPDIVFVRGDRSHILTDRGIEGPPDLVIEVLSPSTAALDRGLKLDRHRHLKVPEYWVVDSEARTVEVWNLADGAAEPVVLTAADTLRWTPRPGDAEFDVEVGGLFDGN